MAIYLKLLKTVSAGHLTVLIVQSKRWRLCAATAVALLREKILSTVMMGFAVKLVINKRRIHPTN